MKKLWLAAVLTAGFMGLDAYSDTVTSVNVVGYMTVDLAEGSADNQTFSVISIPMTKMPVARGTITANTGITITDGNAAWLVNDFAVGGNAVNELGNSTYYVEITSGAYEGRHFYIDSNTDTVLTLKTAVDDPAPNLVGQTYKIIPANRIRDIFGEPGAAILKSGTGTSNADQIQILSGGTWGGRIFHHTGGLWIQAGNPTPVNDMPIDRDEGVLIRRLAGETSPIAITLVGEVSANAQAIVIDDGWNLLGGMSAVGKTLNESGLETVLKAGTGTSNADLIRSFDGTWGPVVFRHIGGLWIQAGSPTPVGDTFIFEAGKSYLFNVDGQKTWIRTSPLTE